MWDTNGDKAGLVDSLCGILKNCVENKTQKG